jgi:hypothetical protein
MTRLPAFLFAALLCVSPAVLADSHTASEGGEEAKAAPEAGAAPESEEGSGVLTEGGVVSDEVAGGRDISAERSPKLVWTEMIEVHDKMYEVSDDRDMRAVVMTPQEQALFVAFSKRMYDLSQELATRVRPGLENADRIKVHRAMVSFRSALGEVRAISGSPIHRDLPRALNNMSRAMKGIWLRFPDSEKALGPESLPSTEELDKQMAKHRY